MPTAAFSRAKPIEYSILHEVTPVGRSLGFFDDHKISEWVVDDFGRRFAFMGVAPRRLNGQFDADALGPGEFIVEPGLVYRIEQTKTSWLAAWLGASRKAMHL